MNNYEHYKLDKTIAYKDHNHGHVMVDDRNLQMHLPIHKHSPAYKNSSLSLKKILSDYLDENKDSINKIWKNSSQANKSVKKAIKEAIKEAENSYETMMQIRESLESAYKEFLHM